MNNGTDFYIITRRVCIYIYIFKYTRLIQKTNITMNPKYSLCIFIFSHKQN